MITCECQSMYGFGYCACVCMCMEMCDSLKKIYQTKQKERNIKEIKITKRNRVRANSGQLFLRSLVECCLCNSKFTFCGKIYLFLTFLILDFLKTLELLFFISA